MVTRDRMRSLSDVPLPPPKAEGGTTRSDVAPRPGQSKASLPPDAKPPEGSSGQITDPITIDMFEVNFVPCKDDEFARVRFYPNGTCDEFTIVLHSMKTAESKKISLELVTALPDVTPFP